MHKDFIQENSKKVKKLELIKVKFELNNIIKQKKIIFMMLSHKIKLDCLSKLYYKSIFKKMLIQSVKSRKELLHKLEDIRRNILN